MSNGAFRVCAEHLSSVSDYYVSLVFLKSVAVLYFSPVHLFPLCGAFLWSPLFCFVFSFAPLFCFCMSFFFLLSAPLFNSLSVSGDWQQWDLTQGGASEKKVIAE